MPGVTAEEQAARKSLVRRNAASANWTEERCDLLAKRWNEGASCREIAAELGMGATRSSVIGKAHRMNLPTRLTVHPKTNARYRRPDAKPRPKAKKALPGVIVAPWAASSLLPVPLPGDTERLKGDAWAALLDSVPRPLIEVAADDGCRWPIGEERPYLFCGNPIHARHYCEAHHAMAFVPVGKINLIKPTGKFKDSRILDEEAA